MSDTDFLYVASLGKRLEQVEKENAKLKELLKNAVEILDQIAKSNSDICFTGTSCNKCSLYQTDTICKWKYADEALKLIGGNKNE